MDFTSNSKWFDSKLLVDLQPTNHGGAADFTKALNYSSYTKWQKRLFKRLGIHSNHWLHFGHVMGPLALQLEELEDLITKAMGNWDPLVFDSRYSCKIPMKGLRVAAGFPQEQGHYVASRFVTKPPEELEKSIFPCLEQKEEQIQHAEMLDRKYRCTAWAFVQLLKELRTVILQDVAELLLKGRKHAVFELPPFKTAEFLAFKEEMRVALESAPAGNPTATVDYRMLSSQLAMYHASVEAAQRQQALQHQEEQEALKAYMSRCMSSLCASFVQSFQVAGQQLGHGPAFTGNPANLSLAAAGNPACSHQIAAGNPAQVANTAGNPAQVTTGGNSPDATGQSSCVSTYRPPAKLPSVSSLYREWHGEAGTVMQGCGGFKKLEEKTSWRQGWAESEKKRWNRMKKLVQIVEGAVTQNPNMPKLHILQFYDGKWQEVNGALTTFLTLAERGGWQVPPPPVVSFRNSPPPVQEGAIDV